MKIAVVYNGPDPQVLQHRGPASQELYSARNIQAVVDALRQNDHEVALLEGDLRLVHELLAFFGPVRDGDWPGLVFNLSFGVQGELRYCHVPGLLELLGLPYVGSGPMGHALSSDKAAAKAMFRHEGLPTPDFVEVHGPDFPSPDLDYPLVVKPVTGASSLGLRLARDERELRDAVADDLRRFREPVLVERFVPGRELNVSLIGNGPPQALPLCEVVVGEGGPPLYCFEDKHGTAQRELSLVCPAQVDAALAERASDLAVRAFTALDCRDWARVELRLDARGEPQLLELNSIPGLGRIASFPAAARAAGMEDQAALLQRLVEVALERCRAGSRP